MEKLVDKRIYGMEKLFQRESRIRIQMKKFQEIQWKLNNKPPTRTRKKKWRNKKKIGSSGFGNSWTLITESKRMFWKFYTNMNKAKLNIKDRGISEIREVTTEKYFPKRDKK